MIFFLRWAQHFFLVLKEMSCVLHAHAKHIHDVHAHAVHTHATHIHTANVHITYAHAVQPMPCKVSFI